GMAVVAVAGLDADFLLVVGLGNVLVAVECHQGRVTDGYRVGPQRQRLGDVGAVADAAGIDQRDLARLAYVVQRLARLADGGDARYAGFVGRDMRPGSGAPFHAVDVNAVGARLGGHAHIVIDPRRPQL